MDEQAKEIISKGIVQVAYKYNAYLPILSNFNVVYDEMLNTMGVDDYGRLIVNPKFAVENSRYIMGLLIHEVLHMFFGHHSRQGTKDAHRFNVAGDCALNQFISEQLPSGAITPQTLAEHLHMQVDNGWGGRDPNKIWLNQEAEYYYELLTQHMEEQQSGGGEEDGGKGEMPNPTCDTDKANSKEVQDKLNQMGVPHVSKEEINEKIMDTAVQMCKAQGNQYGSLTDFAKRLLEPKVDWRGVLRNTLRNYEKTIFTIHERPTFKRVSRRSGKVLFPKRCGRKLSITLSFDTSGSITKELVNQFLSETQGAMKHSNIAECSLWHTSNYWYGTAQALQQNVEKIFESGGTDERCMVEASEHCKADLHIHFSDGYHGTPRFKKKGQNIEVIWDERNNIKEIKNF